MLTEKKQAVALSSVFASALLTVTKLAVGLMTGSLAILSEAAHSGLELVAAVLTWLAVRVSDKPADDDHHYGHGKVESVSALVETGLLFLTSIWIVWEAADRLLFESVAVKATWYSVAVILLSIVVDIGRSRALSKVAQETRSQALEADALHFSSDILSSTAVLIGLGLVALGWGAADAVAALVVACFVVLAGWRLGKRTFDVLIDAAPLGMVEQVRRIARETRGVVRLGQVRVRPAGSMVFIELVVGVSRSLALEQVQGICQAVSERLREAIPEAEPMVHAEPIALDTESVLEVVYNVARNRSLAIHDVSVHQLASRCQVSLDLELDEDMPLAAAHRIASELEAAIREEIGGEVTVDTHLDPRRTRVLPGLPVEGARTIEIASVIRSTAAASRPPVEVHNIKIQNEGSGLYISFHCVFEETLPIRIVHDRTVRLESHLYDKLPGVERILVHAEPLHHHDDISDLALPGRMQEEGAEQA